MMQEKRTKTNVAIRKKNSAAKRVIRILGLSPLAPQGGYHRTTYISSRRACSSRTGGKKRCSTRNCASSIYYLATPCAFSLMHRLTDADELYSYGGGDPLEMLLLYPSGRVKVVVIGPDVLCGQKPQIVVPRGVWQGSRPLTSSRGTTIGYSLATVVAVPAFRNKGLQVASRSFLLLRYPSASKWIRALTL